MSKLGAGTLYEVRIAPHTITRSRFDGAIGNWKIPESKMTLGASNERDAQKEALRIVHARAKLPCLRTIRSQSWPYVKATPVEKVPRSPALAAYGDGTYAP